MQEQQEHLGCPKLSDLGPFALLVLLKSNRSCVLPRLQAKQEELRKSVEKQLDASFGRNVATCLGRKQCTRDASEEFHWDGKANGTLVEKGQREGKRWVDSTFLPFHWHTCLQVSTVFACKHTCTTVIAVWAFYRWNMLISRGKKIQRIQLFHFWEASCAWGYERCLFPLQYCSQGNAPLYCWHLQ